MGRLVFLIMNTLMDWLVKSEHLAGAAEFMTEYRMIKKCWQFGKAKGGVLSKGPLS